MVYRYKKLVALGKGYRTLRRDASEEEVIVNRKSMHRKKISNG